MKKLNLFFLASVLLFLVSSYSFSDDLPDPENMTDSEILAELMNNLESREILANERELILNEREKNLEKREQGLDQKETSIKNREDLQNKKDESSTAINFYWQSLKNDKKNDYWTGFLHGFATGGAIGFVGGGFTGFKIAITIKP